MQVKKQQLELDMEQQTGSKSGKEYVKAILSTSLFKLCAEYIMRNAGLDEAQAGVKIAGRYINNFRYADDITLNGRKRRTKGPLDEIKRCFLLGRKAMTKIDSILKSRDITLPTKFCLVKAMVFPIVMCGCEIWAIKIAER